MTRTHRRRHLLSGSAIKARQRETRIRIEPPKPLSEREARIQKAHTKPSYEVVLEQTNGKKRKLVTEITFSQIPPPGYRYIPAGDPQVTSRCKDLSRRAGKPIWVVSTTKDKRHKMSHETHRSGYHFPIEIVDIASKTLDVTLDKTGRIDRSGPNTAVTNLNRVALTKKQRDKHASLEDSQRELTQAEIDTQAREAIADLFPKLPEHDLRDIVGRAFEKGVNKVGTAAELDLTRRVQLAVVAHIRHNYTDYDEILKQTSWRNARAAVEQPCLDVLAQWRGDMDEDDDPDAMEVILNEVIVIPDDDDESAQLVTNYTLPGQAEPMRNTPIPVDDIADMSWDMDRPGRAGQLYGDLESDDSEVEYLGIQPHVVARGSPTRQWQREDRLEERRGQVWAEALERRKKNPFRTIPMNHNPSIENDQIVGRRPLREPDIATPFRRLEDIPKQYRQNQQVQYIPVDEELCSREEPYHVRDPRLQQPADTGIASHNGFSKPGGQVPQQSRARPINPFSNTYERLMDLDRNSPVLHTPRRRIDPLDSPQYILLGNGELAVKVQDSIAEADNAPRRLIPIRGLPQHAERVMQSIEDPGRNSHNGRNQDVGLDYDTASSAWNKLAQVSASKRPVTPDPRIIDLSADTPVSQRHEVNDNYIAVAEGRRLLSGSVQPQGRLLVPERQVQLRSDLRPEPVEVVYARKSPDRRDASDYYYASSGRPEQSYQRRKLPAHDGRILIPDQQTLIPGHSHQGVKYIKHSLAEQSSFSEPPFRPLSATDSGVSHRSSLIPVHYEPVSPKYGSPYMSHSRDVVPARHDQFRDEDVVRSVGSGSAIMPKMDKLHLRPEMLSDTGSSTRYVPISAIKAQRPLQDLRSGSSSGLAAEPIVLAHPPDSPRGGRTIRAEPVNNNQWSRSRNSGNEALSRGVPLAMYDARPMSASNQPMFVLQRRHQAEGDQPQNFYRGQDEGLQPMMTQLTQSQHSDPQLMPGQHSVPIYEQPFRRSGDEDPYSMREVLPLRDDPFPPNPRRQREIIILD